MLGIIDNFMFEMNNVAFQAIKEKFDFGWSKKQRLYNNPIYMKKNASQHSIDLSGVLVLKKITALDDLISLAKEKRPVTLTLGGTNKVYRVVILSIETNKDTFFKSGEHVKNTFSMKIEEFYQ